MSQAPKIVSDRRRIVVAGNVADNVKPGTHVATDEGAAFSNLCQYGFTHSTVNHGAGEYVRGPVHTNSIEGFWNLFKAAYRGTYVWVSPKYLQTYLHEFEYRWNLRRHAHLMLPVLLQAFARPERRTPSLSASGQSVA
jgi:transposase